MQQGINGASMLTDEQILDMEPIGTPHRAAAPVAQVLGAQESSNRGTNNIAPGPEASGARNGAGVGSDAPNDGPRADNRAVDFDLDTLEEKPRVSAQSADDLSYKNSAASQDVTPQQTASQQDTSQSSAATQTDPAWLKSLEAQPQGGREAAAEARAWRAAASDVASLDAAYFSADAGTRSGLAARLYDNDPAAFRAMLAESARMLSQRDPQGLAQLARELGAAQQNDAPLIAASPRTLLDAINNSSSHRPAGNANLPFGGADGHFSGDDYAAQADSVARVARPEIVTQPESYTARDPKLFADTSAPNASGLPTSGRPELQDAPGARANGQDAQTANATNRGTFPAEAYRSFEAATNEDVARRVHRAIDHTLTTTLPEGMAEGARRRIAEDIFQEVHASLAADRDLGRRLGETLRDWRFDAQARQQISSLLTGRARAVLPEVARRVVAEWTSSVLATDRAKTARIDAASARRDITGGRLPEPVPASSLRPRNIDYHRLSDEQIMEL